MHALCLVCQPMYEASGKNIENHQLKYSLAKNIFHTTCTDIRLHLQDSTQIQASWASKRSDFYQFTYQNQTQETTAPKTTVNSESAAPSFIKLSANISPFSLKLQQYLCFRFFISNPITINKDYISHLWILLMEKSEKKIQRA